MPGLYEVICNSVYSTQKRISVNAFHADEYVSGDRIMIIKIKPFSHFLRGKIQDTNMWITLKDTNTNRILAIPCQVT